jgi:hypothetical protein
MIACLIYFSDALGIIHMQSELLATANDSCHMSHDIVLVVGRVTSDTVDGSWVRFLHSPLRSLGVNTDSADKVDTILSKQCREYR